MGMKTEFYEARDWVRDHLSHDKYSFVSTFETTIRSLGGLLSAYDWSGDTVFLEKAIDLGDRLVKAFDSKSGLPYAEVHLHSGSARNEPWNKKATNVATCGTMQVEFRYLAQVTGKKEYAEKAERAFDVLRSMNPENGLYISNIFNEDPHPSFINQYSTISFSSGSDSFYEYMLKVWLQGGKTESKYREMYDESIEGMHKKLLRKSDDTGLTYIAKMKPQSHTLEYKMEHLACFAGGLLALGAYTDPQGLSSQRAQRDLQTAKDITYTCYQMYKRTPTGLGPEIEVMEGNGGGASNHYLLRPEAVESFYILNKLTGDPIYREWGWEIFQSIEKYCKTAYGYGAHPNVHDVHAKPDNSMESFFLAETLKYLYLLMDPDSEVDFGKHVFNTEAHPLRVVDAVDPST